MNRLKLIKWLSMSMSIVILSACGGGGGSSVASVPIDPVTVDPVAVAIETITNYDGQDGDEVPTVEDYEDAGVAGVNEGNIDSINDAIAEDDNTDTKEDIQEIADEAGKIYENAENGDTNGWSIYDNNSSTATITNVDDADKAVYDTKGSRVIKLWGGGINDGYQLGAEWNNELQRIIKWSMQYDGDFDIYVAVTTLNGIRILQYGPEKDDIGSNDQANPDGRVYTYIHHGLGYDDTTYDDTSEWMTITRNLQADLEEFEPDNVIQRVENFRIRGNGLIDDIEFEE